METRLESFDILVDGDHICSTLLAPATAMPGILFVHGWGGSQEQDLERAREAAGLGCICLTFDLRGHQRTVERRELVTRDENLRDLLSAYDWLASQPNVEPSAIAVVGISYGGYLAAILSSLRPVRWLALRSPALYKDTDWDLPKRQLHSDPDLPDYRRRSIPWQENRALAACATFQGDVLLVGVEHDEIVPHAVTENYITAFTKKSTSLTSRMIAGADHGLSTEEHQQAYTLLLIKWLTEMVVGARSRAAKAEVEHHKSETAAVTPEPSVQRAVRAA